MGRDGAPFQDEKLESPQLRHNIAGIVGMKNRHGWVTLCSKILFGGPWQRATSTAFLRILEGFKSKSATSPLSLAQMLLVDPDFPLPRKRDA